MFGAMRLTAGCLAGLLLVQGAQADQQILDDLVVDGSACVGTDCVNGEVFDFDTVKLKENNLRLLFQDTSNSPSFPTRDWRLVANDSNSGGRDHFTIEDVTGGNEILTLIGGAPQYSLFVNNAGKVGLGTDAPQRNLHLVSGNTAAIRLEQDGSQGFPGVAWDISANEDGLRIARDGADLLGIDNNGNVTISGNLVAGTPASTFPDYVFAADYRLMPLPQLQQYIAREGHLPGIPAAAEVGANGLNMTQFQVQLLEKVEELTLYTLRQQAQIDALKARLEARQ
ncbi:hypothetical protein [Parahaliea mediterranea]|uniref:Uncharacterized protein n=1 Tax=Parahaliea mediterranea TaxID=651086 RepID=A0A939INK2_9GAMM|nr:hypothetical protein [Parahaliea mediterranea]MBN7798645.1 hypothetical protein [Parahaliea mediterranea]